VAAASGDHEAADRWFAEAVRQGPSQPFAYAEWGRAKLARGDLDGAIRLFREAQKRGSRWADPLKWEADALAARSDHQTAVRRYALAAQRAPRWGALHLAWGRSLAALGRTDEAQTKWAEAARLDLSAADRAEAARLLARRTA
jgi:tetratricopeptide (TPR) repeat protein